MFPSGKTHTYTYSTSGNEDIKHNLLSVTDGRRNDSNDPTYQDGPFLELEYDTAPVSPR